MNTGFEIYTVNGAEASVSYNWDLRGQMPTILKVHGEPLPADQQVRPAGITDVFGLAIWPQFLELIEEYRATGVREKRLRKMTDEERATAYAIRRANRLG